MVQTNASSEPSGTNTPSAFRYSRNSSERGRTIVLLILCFANVGYQEENWKVRMYDGVRTGKRDIMALREFTNMEIYVLIPERVDRI
jgi:hypothetical protein